jgi:hypothetical protein
MKKITHEEARKELEKLISVTCNGNSLLRKQLDYITQQERQEKLLELKNQKIELLEEIIKLNNGGIDIGSIKLIQHYRKLREIERKIIDLEIECQYGF